MHRDIEDMAAESRRLREDSKRFEIEQLIVDLRKPEFINMNEAVARVQKYLDDHR